MIIQLQVTRQVCNPFLEWHGLILSLEHYKQLTQRVCYSLPYCLTKYLWTTYVESEKNAENNINGLLSLHNCYCILAYIIAFHLALSIWVEYINLSRSGYMMLQKILSLVTCLDNIHGLPLRYLDAKVPILPVEQRLVQSNPLDDSLLTQFTTTQYWQYGWYNLKTQK
jgi:hypothetical protein